MRKITALLLALAASLTLFAGTASAAEPRTDAAVRYAAQDYFDAWAAQDFGTAYDRIYRPAYTRGAYVSALRSCDWDKTVHFTVQRVTRSDDLAVVRGGNDSAYREYSVQRIHGRWYVHVTSVTAADIAKINSEGCK